jgi:hypothetical protein
MTGRTELQRRGVRALPKRRYHQVLLFDHLRLPKIPSGLLYNDL